ncbi:hypothetical protein ACFWOG_04325 [Kitasatospora sp. NPDC058406]|uniref:hypothetical protein n=1 Tax=Kitasatospora sp. NPDC058406 TaxID=3346483 RepID=UPI003652F12D
MPTDPLWLPTLGYDEGEFRLMDSPLLMSDGTARGSRPGVRPGDPGFNVTLAGTAVNVSAGVASLHRSGQGVYRAQLPASNPGNLVAADGTYSRIDLVYLRVWDTAVDASGLRKADTVYLAGTPGSTPSAPTPAGTQIWITLATITVPPTGSGGTGAATVSTAARQYTVAPGGVLPVSLAADIAAPGSYVGQARFNVARLVPEYWSGSAWAAQGDWAAYTPVWTAPGSNPVIGNGTLLGRWTRIGRTIIYKGRLEPGTTSTGGAGTWQMSLPVGAASDSIFTEGSCAYINTGDNSYLGVAEIASGGTVLTFNVKTGLNSSSAALVTTSSPVTASLTTSLRWTITYEAAT